MSEKVPIDGFVWVTEDELKSFGVKDILALDPNGKTSYIFEVDINIPNDIHNKTSDYPLLPESLKIKGEMISPTSR